MSRITFEVESLEQLIEFDIDHYRSVHSDLRRHSDAALREHYALHGYAEGGFSHAEAVRENFVKGLVGRKTLEIGPFVSPSLTHPMVKYFDVLNTEQLRQRAAEHGLSAKNLPTIHFVSPDGSLDVVDESFELVFSSHNLEHQPDLIRHLNQVSSKLVDGGCFAMLVPNARYCFDADLPLTKISDIFNAHLDRRTAHAPGSIIEHRALTTHNDPALHWKDSQMAPKYRRLDPNRIHAAIKEYEGSDGAYIDVHSWQFEPHTLSDILRALIQLRVIEFSDVSCWGPIHGRNEFAVKLFK